MAELPIFDVKNITFLRGERAIFDGLTLSIPQGKITAIMGPSGIGKTTLLKLITAQIAPDKGEILYKNQPVAQMKREVLFSFRKKVGVLFQSGALFSDMSAYDNVAFPLLEENLSSKAEVKRKVLLALEEVGLRGAKDLMPSELSGGMARRIAFARAKVTEPEAIFFDEPFTGQDPISKAVLVRLVEKTKQQGLSAILISHDIKETLSIADQVYILAQGKVVASGTPLEVGESSDEMVHQFLRGSPDGAIPFHYPAPPLEDELRSIEESS